MPRTGSYSLMVHGGAGALDYVRDNRTAVRHLESLRCTLEHGREILELGGSALQAVEACAALLEDDPVFNAGCGSVLDEDGAVTMDAAIMDGRDLAAGAVAAVSDIANPVQLARRVMTGSGHVMLVAEGALRFAEHCGIPRMPERYLYTPDRIEELNQARRQRGSGPGHDATGTSAGDRTYGTIGAIARDPAGNLAAATSTGGVVNKRMGRVGDSPLIGAGVYADNATCAVSATGHGEDLMRAVIAKTIADFIEMQGMDARQATAAGIDYLTRKLGGRGGVIVLDRTGRCASGFTTPRMIHGWIEQGGESVVRF